MQPNHYKQHTQTTSHVSRKWNPRTEGSSNKALELTDDEKVVLSILKDNSPIDLIELKGQTGLSNKKWDKAIKGLTQNRLAKVEKTDAGLFVSLV